MRVGSLFTGYGGLDMAVGGDLAWYAEIEPAACRVLEAHHPGVPNLGDIKKINWSEVEPVDIITGGYPCQPFSTAGHRKGKHDDRHLWPYIHTAIRTLRPDIAIMENVAGHLSLGFADVLADLAEIGCDADWTTVRASDVGAPHRRARLFVAAYASGAERRDTQYETLGQTINQTTKPRECTGTRWKQYTTAIRRWEHITGRPAPEHSTTSITGWDYINPVFVEWMMGLPEGWVTGHGLSTAQCLKMLGNGVVPQQAAHAIQHLMKGDRNDRRHIHY